MKNLHKPYKPMRLFLLAIVAIFMVSLILATTTNDAYAYGRDDGCFIKHPWQIVCPKLPIAVM